MKRIIQALAQTGEGAFVIDDQFRIVSWNQAARTILSHAPEQVIGRLCYEVLGGRDAHGRTLCQRHCRLAINARQGKTLPNLDVYLPARGGDDRWINLTSIALPPDGPGSGHAIVHLFRDVSQTMGHERFVQQIVAAARKLEDGSNGSSPPGTPADSRPEPDPLTPRERQVLQLLAQGLGTGQLAEALTISPATARNHVQRVLEKLGVHTRLEAVAHAYRHGLVDRK